MLKNSFLSALFTGPKFSIAPVEHNNRGAAKIGEVFPVFATVLNPRESAEIDMGHLVRFLPAKAPVMEGYKVTFDAFAVPYSALGYAERKERDIDDFFNIKENGGEVINPFCNDMPAMLSSYPTFIYGDAYVGGNSPKFGNVFRLGSLGDYLNFPSLKIVREHVRKYLQVNPFLYGSRIECILNYQSDVENPYSFDAVSFAAFALIGNPVAVSRFMGSIVDSSGGDYYDFILGLPFSVADNPLVSAVDASSTTIPITCFYDYAPSSNRFFSIQSLLSYIFSNYPAVASYYGFPTDFGTTGPNFSSTVNAWIASVLDPQVKSGSISLDYLQVLYDNYKVDAQSIYSEYFEYVMQRILYVSSLTNKSSKTLYDSSVGFLPLLGSSDPIDLSFFAAYWKIISDWYINTNIDGDPEDFFLRHCKLLSPTVSIPGITPTQYVDVKPFRRRWANDVFTSSVPAAMVNNIRIPVDGTIPDLREANAYQKLVDIFRNTGRRLRDVIYGVFGITPSAVRSEMSEPIGTRTSWIGMQSVLQTSETTPDSPQAAYAGIGTDSQGHGRLFKYVNNEEPTPVIVMVLMSVTQRASYMQGFDRKFFRSSIYDFAIPQLAMIGEQEVTNKELYFDKGYTEGTFGFNRRYYDWFYMPSEVHSDLRDSLDFWHGARIFDDMPYLNSEFIGVESAADHLQRVFANTSESANPILYNLSFEGYKTVALPRYIQYEL